MNRSRFLTVALTALLLSAGTARAALPAGYTFSSITDAIPAEADYKAQFADQQFSIATATNNNGLLYGFRLTGDGMVRGFNIAFGSNPKMTAVDSEYFIALSAADVTCWWIFCNTEYPFGIRLIEDADTGAQVAVTAFLNTPTDSTALPGSLPFLEYPGNFVDENKNGVVASTQLGAGSQFGVLIHANGQVLLSDVPWLIAINDLTEPLVLAYGNIDGACAVYGPGCRPPTPADCEDDDRHHGKGAENGMGHEEHGNGHGYGHDDCEKPGKDDDKRQGKIAAGKVVAPNPAGALLIRLLADGSTRRYRFPPIVTAGDAVYKVNGVFPLALNDNRAVLRGDISVGSSVQEKRLLSCVFNPAVLDAGADGTVDCTGGMTVIGGIAGSIRVGTVLGFALNNAGVLAGNYGFSAAGVGTPFLLDVTAATPVPEPLLNLAVAQDGWELNTLTDLNQSGKLVGYGYKNCAAQPEAFFLNTQGTAPAGVRFQRSGFESPAWLAPNDTLAINPVLTGGSGSYQLRVLGKKPADADWTLLSDWTTGTPQYQPRGYRGDICLRVQVRDSTALATVREQVVRYRVSPAATASSREAIGNSAPVEPQLSVSAAFADLIGSAGGALLLVLATLVLRRRRRV